MLSFLVDEDPLVNGEDLWDVYYHAFVDNDTIKGLVNQISKLLHVSSSIEFWKASRYAKAIQFCDADTLADVRRVWERILREAESFQTEDRMKNYENNFRASKDCYKKHGKGDLNLAALRAAAPLSLQAQVVTPLTWTRYWKDGTVTLRRADAEFPNPLLIGLLSDFEILHYASDPVQCFHIATAYTPLVNSSPLLPPETEKNLAPAAAAKTQFKEWTSAAKQLLGKRMVTRYACAEALAFSHTLQSVAEGASSANMYRRPWDSRPLNLDEPTPTAFDLIETSNLAHHIGALNIIVAAGPLLIDQPWATLFTDTHIDPKEAGPRALKGILCADVSTVALLLGLSPVEYWTNCKCESHLEELVNQRSNKVSAKVSWKPDHQLSGHPKGRGKLHIDEDSLCRLLLPLARRMIEPDAPTDGSTNTIIPQGRDYPHFHYGSIAVLLKMLKKRVQTNWEAVHIRLFDLISGDRTLLFSSNLTQDFAAQLHAMGVDTQPWLKSEMKVMPEFGAFNLWKSIPEVVSLTLVIPHANVDRLYYGRGSEDMYAPILLGSVRSSPGGPPESMWHNMFGGVHLTFGTVRETSTPDKDDYEVSVDQDEAGWLGDASLIASFYVPTSALQVNPRYTRIGLMVQHSVRNSLAWRHILGADMFIQEERFVDRKKVLITKHMPGQKGYPVVCGHAKDFPVILEKPADGEGVRLDADVSTSEDRITAVKGHLSFTSGKAKKLLADKVPIELQQKGPFVIDVVFDDGKLISPVRFPVPVRKERSTTRIARKSGYIEVIAPVAQPGDSKELADFALLVVLSPTGVPVAMNAPHLNLDALPIIDLQSSQEKLRWLTTLTSLQFSDREKRLRELALDVTGISDDTRVNFKESLFSMFMLSSGLQGGQTGLFAINHPGQGGIHMLIFVSAIRLDGDSGSVVLDAAIIPFSNELVESGELETFLLILRTLECCTLEVNDEELILWKKVLPALVERCRTWEHTSKCEYKEQSATIPLSLKEGRPVVCSCGEGEIPENFMNLPEWETAAMYASRLAISPLFAVSFVEQVLDRSLLTELASEVASMGLEETPTDRCRTCNKKVAQDGGSLKRCNRCRKARYCSAECQKKDWKKHRMECKEEA